MLVSIITPSLNQGAYIEQTITSVLNQDYPHIEHIIVDGGSSDSTLKILRRYDSHITWVSEPDNGQADAINKGIQMAKGEVVSWLNSDDILLPGAVRKVVDCFCNDPDVQMVYGKSHFIDTTGKIIGRYPTETFNFERLATFNFISQPSTFFKRGAFCEVGGLNRDFHYAFDMELWIRLAKRFRVRYFPEFFSGYRLHEKSKTMAYDHALKNHYEGLRVTLAHFNWAPANRVYGYYYHLIEARLPSFLRKVRPLVIVTAVFVSAIKYLALNKGVRMYDIKTFHPHNLRKIAMPWDAIYKTY